MTDYTELKRLAEAAQYEKHEFENSLVTATRKFFEGCIPEQILELIAERDQVKAEVEALRKDAGRYRWLRDYAWLNEKGVDHMMSIEYPGLQNAEESPESAENKGAEGGLHD